MPTAKRNSFIFLVPLICGLLCAAAAHTANPGEKIREFATGHGADSSPAVSDGFVYVGSMDEKPNDAEIESLLAESQEAVNAGSRVTGGTEVAEAGTPDASEVESFAGVGLDELLKKEKELMPRLAEDSGIAARLQLAAVRTAIADRYIAEKKVDSAVTYLTNACLLDNTNAARWEKLGDWLMFLPEPGISDLEQHAYESALLLSPQNRDVRIKLAGSYVADRCYSDAIPHLEKVICGGEDAPEPEWIHIGLLTCCYVATGELDRGRDFLRECAGLSGDNRFLIAYALLERAAGRTEEAAGLLELVESSEQPGSPLALYARHILNAGKSSDRQEGDQSKSAGSDKPADK